MFDDTLHEITMVTIPLDRDAIVKAITVWEQLGAHIADAVGAFDAAALWDLDAATSMTAWLRDHANMSRAAAAHLASRAKRLRQLPVTAAAFRAGGLSAGQVDAILANVSTANAEIFAGHEAELIPTLAAMSVDDTAEVMREWSRRADDIPDPQASDDTDDEPDRKLYLSSTLDGRRVLDGDFDDDGGALVETALRVATRKFDPNERRTPAQRRADALVDISQFFLDNNTGAAGNRTRPHITLVSDIDKVHNDSGVARYLDGGATSPGELSTLLCDSAVCRLLVKGTVVLDLGHTARTVSDSQFRVLAIRDEHCRMPGCDRPARWCEAHHVIWYRKGGHTKIENLVLLCRRHHRRLHKHGWHATMTPDGTLTVTDPNSRTRSTRPPGLPLEVLVS